MNRVERAAEYHKKGYNCAQAIVCAFCDKVGLDEETAFKVSEGLGLGVSDTYGTCGAVTGMAYYGNGEQLWRFGSASF